MKLFSEQFFRFSNHSVSVYNGISTLIITSVYISLPIYSEPFYKSGPIYRLFILSNKRAQCGRIARSPVFTFHPLGTMPDSQPSPLSSSHTHFSSSSTLLLFPSYSIPLFSFPFPPMLYQCRVAPGTRLAAPMEPFYTGKSLVPTFLLPDRVCLN